MYTEQHKEGETYSKLLPALPFFSSPSENLISYGFKSIIYAERDNLVFSEIYLYPYDLERSAKKSFDKFVPRSCVSEKKIHKKRGN
jgi:hypothetical protein